MHYSKLAFLLSLLIPGVPPVIVTVRNPPVVNPWASGGLVQVSQWKGGPLSTPAHLSFGFFSAPGTALVTQAFSHFSSSSCPSHPGPSLQWEVGQET